MLNELDNIGLKDSGVTSFKYFGEIGTIKQDAFRNCNKLYDINIPYANEIEDNVFEGCHSINSITIPGIEILSNNIFGNDKPSKLYQIEFSYGTKDICTVLNNLSSLINIIFPDTLQTLQTGAFYGCNKIQSLQFGRNVDIDNYAFAGMNSLLSITIPPSDKVDDYSFSELSNLDSISILSCENYFKFKYNIIKNTTISKLNFGLDGINIADFTIDFFSGCKNLQEVNLSNSQIKTLNSDLFDGCTSLRHLYLPDSITNIQINSLKDTRIDKLSLNDGILYINYLGKQMNFDRIPSTLKQIGGSTFLNSQIDDNNITLPNIINKFSPNTFSGSNISSIDINFSNQGGVIPASFFRNCQKMEHVGLYGQPIIEADESSFYNCSLFNDDDLLSSITTVGNYAFYNTRIQQLTSEKLKHIGDYAFAKTSLTTIYLNNNLFRYDTETGMPIELGEKIFDKCEQIVYIYAEDTTVDNLNSISNFFGRPMVIDYTNYEQSISSMYDAVMTAFGIIDQRTQFTMYLADGIVLTKTGEKQYYTCLELNEDGDTLTCCNTQAIDFKVFLAKNAILPYYITKITEGAFNQARGCLSTINLFNVKHIPNSLFKNAQYLSSVYSNGDCISSIGSDTFYGCSKLQIIPQFVNLISCGDRSFYQCTSIKSFNFNRNLKTIGNQTFYNCYSLNSIAINDNLEDFGLSTFYGCMRISSLDLYENNPIQKTLYYSTLYGCDNISSLDVPLSIGIDTDSFSGMKKLTKVKLTNTQDLQADIKLNVVDYSGDNIFGFNNSTEIFLNRNDLKYPSYIIKNSKILKINNSGFNTELNQDEKIALHGFDSTYCINQTITENEFINIDIINTDTFSQNETIRYIELPEIIATSGGIQYAAFRNIKNLNGIYIDSPNQNQYSFEWFTGDKNSSIFIQFSNGILTKDGFIEDDGIFYDKNGTIFKVNPQNTISNVTISQTHRQISSFAFTNDTTITCLNTGYINKIYPFAFYQNNAIKQLTISDKTKNISEDAFKTATIVNLTVDGGLEKVSKWGFEQSKSLKTINYGEGIVEICPSAMIDCLPSLSSIRFPTTLQKIGQYAYAEPYDTFPRLDNVNFNELPNLSIIDSYSFYNSIHTLNNNTLSLINGELSIMDYAFAYNRYTYTQLLNDLVFQSPIDLTSGVKYIGRGAFEYNHLRNIDFGEKLETIAEFAFAYPKYKYNNVLFPNSLKSIKRGAFKNNIVLNPYKTIKNMFYFENDILNIPTIFNVTINDKFEAENIAGFTDTTCLSALYTDFYTGFSYIYDNKMNFCPTGTKIDIINKVLVEGNDEIENVYVPKYIKTIGQQAFLNCTNLKTISVLQGTDIQESAFYGCINLQRFNEEDSKFYILSASDYAFYNCHKLENIRLLSSATYVGDSSFENCYSITEFYDDIDGEYFRYYSLSSIGNASFRGCSSLTRFDICRNISSIGDNAFDNCIHLDNINIDLNSYEFNERISASLDMSALIIQKFFGIRDDFACRINFKDISYNNDGIVKNDNEYLEISSYEEDGISKHNVYKLKYDKFQQDSKSYLNISSVSKIDSFVFCKIEELNSISFLANKQTNENIEHIGQYCFFGCENLYNINGGSLNCSTVGEYAFGDCKSLTSMAFDSTKISSIGRGAFYQTKIDTLIFYGFEGDFKDEYEQKIQHIIGHTDTLRNPLSLPIYCNILLKNTDGEIIGKYNYLFVDLMNSNIDINRNQIVFIDKTTKSIRPLVLIKAAQKDRYPTIVNNTFHANIVGRWK